MITLLELLSVIERKGQNINGGKIVVAIDASKACRGIINHTTKLHTHTRDAGAEISEMNKLLQKIRFEIEFELVRAHELPVDHRDQSSTPRS